MKKLNTYQFTLDLLMKKLEKDSSKIEKIKLEIRKLTPKVLY